MRRYVIDGLRPGTEIIVPRGGGGTSKVSTHELGALMSEEQVAYLRDVLEYAPREVEEPTVTLEVTVPNADAVAQAEIVSAHTDRAKYAAEAEAARAQSIAIPVVAHVKGGRAKPGPVRGEDI